MYLLQRKLKGVDLWRTSFNLLKGSLIAAGQLLAAWLNEASTLTSDWAVGLDAGGHLWEGPVFTDSHVAACQDRIERVSEFDIVERSCGGRGFGFPGVSGSSAV